MYDMSFLHVVGQGYFIFIREKSENFEKCCGVATMHEEIY